MNPVGWIRFFSAVLPELTELARELWKRHQGNVASARAELTAIRDHGARLRAAEVEIDARLEQLRRDRPGEH